MEIKIAIRDDVNEIVHRIEFINTFYEFAISGSYVRQRDNFNLLVEIATEEELINLTSHKNGVIRCYAFKGLLRKESKAVKEVYKKLKNDNEIIVYIHGCIRDRKSVSYAATKMYIPEPAPLIIIHKKKTNKFTAWLRSKFFKKVHAESKMTATN